MFNRGCVGEGRWTRPGQLPTDTSDNAQVNCSGLSSREELLPLLSVSCKQAYQTERTNPPQHLLLLGLSGARRVIVSLPTCICYYGIIFSLANETIMTLCLSI